MNDRGSSVYSLQSTVFSLRSAVVQFAIFGFTYKDSSVQRSQATWL